MEVNLREIIKEEMFAKIIEIHDVRRIILQDWLWYNYHSLKSLLITRIEKEICWRKITIFEKEIYTVSTDFSSNEFKLLTS